MEGFTQKVYAIFGKIYQQESAQAQSGPESGTTNADGSVNGEGSVQ